MKKAKSVNKKSLNRSSERFSPIDLEKTAKKVEHESALIRIGKNGITENIREELRKIIPLKKAVKIKILQNAPVENPKEFFEQLEQEIGFKLWRMKGSTGIFIFKKIK